MLAALAALSLSLGVAETPAAFEPAPLEASLLDGAGGEVGAGRSLAFVGLGALGAGGSLLVGLPLMSQFDSAVGSVLLIVPVLATMAIQVGVGALLGIEVSWASSGVGTLLGVAAGVGLGAAFAATSGGGEGFADLAMFLLGMMAGYAVGSPIFTLADPFGLAGEGGGGDLLPPEARPLAPQSALAPSMELAGWSGRW